MGAIAARLLLERLSGGTCPQTVMVAPELVVRGSTGPSPALRARPKRRAAR
jgi:DNA-binding LacI/PurR family transcriptional regulator